MDFRSLMKRLIDAGFTEKDMFHHYSDLYVYVTPESTKIVEEWCRERGFRRAWMCPMFRSNIDGKPMYDCAFAYEPKLMELDT